MISGIGSSSMISTASLTETRQKLFDQVDTNGDGSIDKDELAALTQENTSGLIDQIFDKIDTDKDGLISKIESEASLSKLDRQMQSGGANMPAAMGVSPPPEEVFDAADTNKDGVVSKDELAAALGQNVADIEKLFSEVDADGDGSISRAEDDAFLEKMKEGMPESTSTNAMMSHIGTEDQDWQIRMFDALLRGLAVNGAAFVESTSIYA